MIKSMTGFGKSETALAGGKLYVEIRSLNGKTADISIKTSLLPKDREIEVRKMIAAGLERGNIDFFMTYEPNAAESARTINPDIVMNYYSQISGIRQRLGLSNAGSDQEILASILRFQDVMSAKKEDVINDDNWNKVENCIKEAISHLNEFRSKEGAILYRDVTSKVASILACVDEVEKFLEAEMIYYIEKLDINEEKVRLRQHCRYFLDTIEKDPFPGKKLGFIAQEMGREINTTGSKANNTDIQKLVVNMKDDLEKIKEQSLNIL